MIGLIGKNMPHVLSRCGRRVLHVRSNDAAALRLVWQLGVNRVQSLTCRCSHQIVESVPSQVREWKKYCRLGSYRTLISTAYSVAFDMASENAKNS